MYFIVLIAEHFGRHESKDIKPLLFCIFVIQKINNYDYNNYKN